MIEHPWMAVATVAAALSVGVVSPGPSFVMVARTALARSRADGVAASVGMGLGGTAFAILALFGLQALLATAPTLYVMLRMAGGAWLAWLGWRIWRGADDSLVVPHGRDEAAPARPWRSFAAGLATQLGNPKTAVVYGSVFASLMPRDAPLAVIVTLPIVVFLIETGWYALVAIVLSADAPRARYLRAKGLVDRLAGGVMVVLGLQLVVGARH